MTPTSAVSRLSTLDHACTVTPHPPHEVTVTITQPPLPPGTVDIELKRSTGTNGAAVFTNNNQSTISVTGTVTLAVRGTQASDAIANLVMEAKLDGLVCTSVAFTVVDVATLTATEHANQSNAKSDTTQADQTNVLWIGEQSNGTAKVDLTLTWSPSAYAATNFRWEVVLTNGAATSQWSPTNSNWTTNPVSLTWTNMPTSGPTNREFLLRGWFDCDGDGKYTNTKPHRQVSVTVVKADIDDIKGLYTSNGTYQAGYTSTDNVGRVYCNSEYDPANPASNVWSKNKQYIDVTVKVSPTNATLPADARIVWEWEDPDDPSDSGMTTNAAAYVDPNGSSGNDNTGTNDSATIWEQIDSYTLGGTSTNETIISNGYSKVRFNVTDNGGDNFIVKPKLKLNAGATPWDGAQAGIMTVWKRLRLERTQMTSANTLDCSDLNSSVGKAFVEFALESVTSVSDGIVQSGTPPKWYMGTNWSTAYSGCENYVEAPPTGEFSRAGQEGWFFLASTEYLQPNSGATPVRLINPNSNGLSTVQNATNIYLPIAIPSNQTPASVTIWKDVAEFNATGSQYVSFRCRLDTNDASRRTILSTTNRWEFPYYQPVTNMFATDPKDLLGLGFTNSENIAVEVWSAGALVTSGISPTESTADKFQGRTIVFHSGGKSTISHELVHGLGMAHLCGHRDHTGAQTCLMHYGHFWLLKSDGTLDRWVRGTPGLKLCPEHIKALRETRLEEESTSRKLDW